MRAEWNDVLEYRGKSQTLDNIVPLLRDDKGRPIPRGMYSVPIVSVGSVGNTNTSQRPYYVVRVTKHTFGQHKTVRERVECLWNQSDATRIATKLSQTVNPRTLPYGVTVSFVVE